MDYPEKIDYKKVLENILNRYQTADDSFDFFELYSSKKELGIVSIDKRNKKFDIRGEKTPSVVPKPKLSYIDYGGDGERKNIIHLIRENTKCSFVEAIKILAQLVKEDVASLEKDIKIYQKQENKERAIPYSEKYIQEQINERNKIENKDLFLSILKGLCRGCSIEEMRVGVKAFNIGLNSYEQTNQDTGEKYMEHRLFIPEYDENNVPYGSYRYNRAYTGKKGLLRTNCKRVLFGSNLMKYFNKNIPLIVSEGHSDTIVNVSKYLQCVTTGSSTTKIGPFLELLKGWTLHFYPDADQPGIKGVTMKILEILEFNESIQLEEDKIKFKVFWWGSTFEEKDIDVFKKLYLPLEYIKKEESLKSFSKKWWLRHFNDENLDSKITVDILKKEQEFILDKYKKENKKEFDAPKELFIDSWTLVSSKNVPQGFDFIDFHSQYNTDETKEKYNKFISKYKFK